MRGNTKILTWLLMFAIVVAIFCFLVFLDFEIEMKAILITMLFGLFTYLFTYEQKRQDEISNKEKIELENKIRIKTEVYDKFMEALSNYKYKHSTDKDFKEFQVARFKTCLYADDDTVKAFMNAVPIEARYKYKIDDPLSNILYSIRKEVNPDTEIRREEMMGVDPAQWTMELNNINNK